MFYGTLSIIIPQTLVTIVMIKYSWQMGEIFVGPIISILSIIIVLYSVIKRYSNKIVLSKKVLKCNILRKVYV